MVYLLYKVIDFRQDQSSANGRYAFWRSITKRENRGWSQDYLAEKIYVSRQSVSKWETNKNYPSIEMIINLSDLFDITLDEYFRRDDELKEEVSQDSEEEWGWKEYSLVGI